MTTTPRPAPTPAIAADLAPTGTLRASVNLGNPVLAQGTPEAPSGITVDLAREIGARLGLPVELLCFDAARKSFEAMADGRADLCFLAVDPARETEVAFTAPYVVIEGVYAVPRDSGLTTVEDVDVPGIRIGVKQGSAYDLFLSRSLAHATVVRGEEGVDTFRKEGLEVGAADPAADDLVRRRASRSPVDRGPVHGDPAGGRHDGHPRPGDRRLPPRHRRGAEGERLRRGLAPPRRAGFGAARPARLSSSEGLEALETWKAW